MELKGVSDTYLHESIWIHLYSPTYLTGSFCSIGVVVAVYFLGGIAYNRIVHHARGLKQIPNYQIWVEGFDFIKVNTSEELRNVMLG